MEHVAAWATLAAVVLSHSGEEWRAPDGTSWPVSVLPILAPELMERPVSLVHVGEERAGRHERQIWVFGAGPPGERSPVLGRIVERG